MQASRSSGSDTRSIKKKGTRVTRVSRSAFAAPFRQMPAQLLILAFVGTDVLVDCLMSQPGGCATDRPQPTRNLFRRPAVIEAVDNGSTLTESRNSLRHPGRRSDAIPCAVTFQYPSAIGTSQSCRKFCRSFRQIVDRSRGRVR
jgi:hypothetical protein